MGNQIISEDIRTIASCNLEWHKLKGKTVLITGASGFLASYVTRTILHLNDTLFSEKATVIALIRNVAKAKKAFTEFLGRDDLILFQQDLSVPFTMDIELNYIIHAASPASSQHFSVDPVGTLMTNTTGTASLLDLAKDNPLEKFIFFSSGEVYGGLDDMPGCVDETYTGNVDCLDVRSCYAESKRMAENMCACWSHQHKVPTSIIRVGYTYGPGIPLTDDRVIADFVHKIINDQDLTLHSDGSAYRSFCYITDMIEAVFRVLLLGEDRQAYNASSDVQTSILELASLLTGLFPEKNLKVQALGETPDENYLRSKRQKTHVCIEKIRKLGWKPKVDLETGFRRMVKSYL